MCYDITAREIDAEKTRWKKRHDTQMEYKRKATFLRDAINRFEPPSKCLGPVNVALVGNEKSGCTSLVSIMQRSLQDTSGLTSARPGLETEHVTHYKMSDSVRLFDIPSTLPERADDIYPYNDKTKSLINAVEGDVADGEVMSQPKPEPERRAPVYFNSSSKRAHVIIFVFSAEDLLRPEMKMKFRRGYEPFRNYLNLNSKPILTVPTPSLYMQICH